jgi:hypothetical protein
MKDGDSFTTKAGCRYTVSKVSTWTTGGGKVVTTGHVDMDNPATHHGWGGTMTEDEWNYWRQT